MALLAFSDAQLGLPNAQKNAFIKPFHKIVQDPANLAGADYEDALAFARAWGYHLDFKL